MKTLLIAVLGAAAVLVSSPSHASDKSLVTVVTSPEPQTQLMAMVLTMQAVQQGAQTEILLCGPAGDMALKDAPQTATAPQPPRNMSPQGLMQAIMDQGATVRVCAIYLPGREAGPDVLIDGVGVARPPEMAAAMLAEDTRVWSF